MISFFRMSVLNRHSSFELSSDRGVPQHACADEGNDPDHFAPGAYFGYCRQDHRDLGRHGQCIRKQE